MNEFMLYQRKGTVEARPYVPGEDLTGISVSKEDTPKDGDMIARNPANHNDMWFVNQEYFQKNYVCV